MFNSNNLKVIIRNLHRNGLYSWINIAGLAASLTIVIFITLWVWDEMSFDRFHKRSKDIYQVNVKFQVLDDYMNYACGPLAFAAKAEIPEVENACRGISWWTIDMLQNRERDIIVNTGISTGVVDSTFFSVFDFKILEGDPRRMLIDSESIVLSESIAAQLFGDDYPTGKLLFDNRNRQYRVAGVMADMPQNSSVRFNILLPFTFFEQMDPNSTTDWMRANFQTWFLLRPNANVTDVEAKIAEIVSRQVPEDKRYSLQSIEALNFRNADGTANAKAQTSRMFVIIAFALVLVACINYVNISTAQASRRDKEIFMRTILGARKSNLFFGFLNESALMFLISLITATALLYILFPVFNKIAGKQLIFHYFSVQTLIVFGLSFLIVVIFAGIYPAINLAFKKPLQGISAKRGNVVLRRVLVVGQFVVAILLVSVTVAAARQLEFIKKKDLGYEKENIFYVHWSGVTNRYDVIKTELSRIPTILGVTATNQPLTDLTSLLEISEFEGSDVENLRAIMLRTDSAFFSTMNIPLVTGRGFEAPNADNVIINETAVRNLNITAPIGKTFTFSGRRRTVIGVVQDFHFKSLYMPIEPLVIVDVAPQSKNVLYVKTTDSGVSQAIAAVENLWTQFNPNMPFSYHFIDDDFETVYKTDIRSGVLFQIFAFVAILISCLGLFGLLAYIAKIKTKEIAIRKVMGANVGNIVYMLSKEFMILLFFGMLIAFPLAYHQINKMLQDYAYRIDISWQMFALAGLIAVVLTLLTIGWKALKAATENPVKAIKL